MSGDRARDSGFGERRETTDRRRRTVTLDETIDETFVDATGADTESDEDQVNQPPLFPQPQPVQADVHQVGGDDSESTASEEEGNPGGPEDPNPDAMANAQQHQVANGGQISSLTPFEGKEGLEVLNFLEQVSRAQIQFNWSSETTANVAMSRMNGVAQDWLRGTKLMGVTFQGNTAWEDLSKAMKERFSPVITSATAVEAVKDLRQHADESVSMFYDRIVHSLDRKNHGVPDATKLQQAYQTQYKADIVTFFLGGLRENISKKVMAAADPPTTPEDSLKRARAVEAAEGRTKIPIMAVETQSTSEQEAHFYEVDAVQANRVRQGGWKNAQRGRRNRSNDQCFNCKNYGHWANECPRKDNAGRGRGGGGGQRGQGRRFQRGNRRRGQFEVEVSKEDPDPNEDECPEPEWQEEPYQGNE